VPAARMGAIGREMIAMTRAALWVSILAAVSTACSSSSTTGTPPKEDAGEQRDSGGQHDASDHHDAGADGGCPASPKCTGSVSGGVTGEMTACTLSPEQGQKLGIGKVTFSFTADGGAAGQVMGSGEVSTKGGFSAGTYVSDGGLWNDITAADSLWTVSFGSVMPQCNGTMSPDEIDSLCAGATLDVTSVDSCTDIHGTFDTTIPAYMGAPSVTIHLAF